MHNYSNFCRDLKNEINNFLKETVFPYFDRTRNKLILSLFCGILKTGSLKLSEVARVLKENNLGSTENRISIGLMNYDLSLIQNGIINYSYSSILKYPVEIEVDETDVIKPYGKEFEDLYYIHDGSKEERPKEKGYYVTGIIMIGLNNTIIPVSLNLYSTISKEFKSTIDKTSTDLDYVLSKCISLDSITITFDRGYDNKTYINYCEDLGIEYCIRAKNLRKYYTNKGYKSIDELEHLFKGKYSFTFIRNGELTNVKASSIKIKHKDFKKEAYLVFESFENEKKKRFYMTNIDCSDKEGCIKALKCYRKRWRIEEYFRFIKQEFNLEGFMVRETTSMNNLFYIVNLIVVFLTTLFIKKNKTYYSTLECYKSFKDKNRELDEDKYSQNGLMLYRIKRGIQDILSHTKLDIEVPGRSRKKKEYKQLSLFEIKY